MYETEEQNPFYGNPYLDEAALYEPDVPPPSEPPQKLPSAAKPNEKFTARKASEVKDDEIKYLWKPYILRGDVTIMAAAGGTGKTFALCGIAAELTNGRYPLNPFEKFDPMSVLFISAEDPDFILRERMHRAGADLDRVFILDAKNSARLKLSDGFGQPCLSDLETLIEKHKPDLVVIDPMHAFIGSSVKMTEQSVIRPFMQALASLAKKHNCAIVDVAHVSKRPAGSNANDAILGATDIVNAARSVLRVIFDETGTDPNRRVIVHTKSNYAAMGMSVAFRIDENGTLEWTGYSDVNRGDLEAAARNNKALSEHMVSKEAERAARSFVVERLLALSEEQTEPKRFYSYDTLRSMGITGRPDIVACVGELKQKGVGVSFPNSPRRVPEEENRPKRGIVLVRVTEGDCV